MAPTAVLTTPTTAFTGEVILVDARLSTNVSTAPQADSTPSVVIDFGDGFTCNLLACGHAYLSAGVYTNTLTVKDVAGQSATTSNSITITDIPTGTTQTLADTGNVTTNATNLQAAITTAAAANTTEQTITMPSGFVAAGPITMPVPVDSKYITLKWVSLTVANNHRVSATDMATAPTITAPSSEGNSTPALRTPAVAPSSPPHHYRILGLHFKKDDQSLPATRLLDLGTDSGGGQTTVAKIPHHFIVDRCWFDGGASDTSQTTNAIRIYSDYVTIKDSLLAEFRLVGAGIDASAISLASGQGPYAFWNNTMVATSENFNIAGGPTAALTASVTNGTTTSATLSTVVGLAVDMDIAFTVGGLYNSVNTSVVRSISGNDITFDAVVGTPNGTAEWAAAEPSFIEFRRNYLYKPLTWWPLHASWNGVNYQIKNLYEMKWGRYTVVDGNYIAQTWVADQTWAVPFTARNQNGGEVHSACIRQLQWSNNILKDAPNGYNISAKDDGTTQANTSARSSDFTFRNNLNWNTGVNWDSTGASHAFINLGQADADNKLRRIFIIHNTHDNGTPDNTNGNITDFAGGPPGGAIESVWVNNVHQDGGSGFRSNASSTNSAQNITDDLPPGTSANWNKNLIVNINGHTYPAAAITLAANWTSGVFVDYSAGDFTLQPASPGKNAATDGTDIGVDLTTLTAATRGCITGVWDYGPTVISGNVTLSGNVQIG
jgi:hypothetical protein